MLDNLLDQSCNFCMHCPNLIIRKKLNIYRNISFPTEKKAHTLEGQKLLPINVFHNLCDCVMGAAVELLCSGEKDENNKR